MAETRLRVVNIDDLSVYEGQRITLMGDVQLVAPNGYTLQMTSTDGSVAALQLMESQPQFPAGIYEVIGPVMGGRIIPHEIIPFEEDPEKPFDRAVYNAAVDVFNRIVAKPPAF